MRVYYSNFTLATITPFTQPAEVDGEFYNPPNLVVSTREGVRLTSPKNRAILYVQAYKHLYQIQHRTQI